MEPNEIQDQLTYFTSTEKYWKVTPQLVVTDGVKFLADACGAYWLLGVVESHLPYVKGSWAFVSFNTTPSGEGRFTVADDNPAGTVFARQTIEWTDFPLREIHLYLVRDPYFWVLMLPSEY